MIQNIAFVVTMMPNIITKHIRYKSYLKYFLKRDWIQHTNALEAENAMQREISYISPYSYSGSSQSDVRPFITFRLYQM